MIAQGFSGVNTFSKVFSSIFFELLFSRVFTCFSLVFSLAIFTFPHQAPGRQGQVFRASPALDGQKQLPPGGGLPKTAQKRGLPGVVVQPAQGPNEVRLPAGAQLPQPLGQLSGGGVFFFSSRLLSASGFSLKS